MAFTIPTEKGEPTIKVFESVKELQAETGQTVCHGFFDAESNMIIATADSVAHEVGHYLDFKSGKLKVLKNSASPIKKIEACLRNEIVAILFAYTKCGEGGASLIYEVRFLEWLRFTRRSQKFGPHAERSLLELNLKEIQDLADWVTLSEHSWFDRLNYFFKNYLADDQTILTYGQNSIKLKSH
ncbi:MAG: hypothetical protein JWQ35_1168 [Bacteriovoracaceae bacterium]|nr:hypothetical protein [Bacteriovoracaceae bacterium]